MLSGGRRNSLEWLFFFNDTATTEIYTLSLHDALPIYRAHTFHHFVNARGTVSAVDANDMGRSEEHTSELQSLAYLVCRLLLEKTLGRHAIAGRRDLRCRATANVGDVDKARRDRGEDREHVIFFFNDAGAHEVCPFPPPRRPPV